MENDFLLPIKSIKQLPAYCGPACIEMVLKFYNIKNIDQKKIGKELGIIWREGCFPYQVIRFLKKYKIICVKDRSKKRPLEYFEKTKQPIILGEVDHFTLLVGKNKDRYIVIDPYYGKAVSKNYNYFQKIKEYLIIVEVNGVKYEKNN